MEQPKHDLRSASGATIAQATPRRFIALGIVALLHVVLIYALAAGLAGALIQKLPEELKAEVVKEQIPEKTPPPPPPDLAKPPPPFVPPPEINITTEAPSTNAITTQSKVATPPPAKPNVQLTMRGRTHTLPPYPEVSRRLSEEGTTKLKVTIDTSGDCTDAVVIGSSGHDRLDQAAVEWVRSHWKWNPPIINGTVSSAQTEVDIVWSLKNG